MQDWSEIRVLVGEGSEMIMNIHTFAGQLYGLFMRRKIISFCPAYNRGVFLNMSLTEANEWCLQQFEAMSDTDSEEFSDSDDEDL